MHIDFETRSAVDLKAAGVYNYARDPSTRVLLMSWAFADEEPALWRAWAGEPFPAEMRDYLAGEGAIYAHNAAFERLMFWFVLCPDYDLPEPDLRRFRCTAAQARSNGLPGALGDCARALGVTQQKDRRGADLIRLLSVPRSDGTFLDDPELLDEFGEYCRQDVRAERAIHSVMRDLTATEWEQYHTAEIINDRGIPIDRELAALARKYADTEMEEIRAALPLVTGGAVETPRQFQRLKAWLAPRLTSEQLDRCMVGEKFSLDKRARASLLEDADHLPPEVREVIELTDAAGKSSVSKFTAMLARADEEDDRVRGAYMFAGAASTGRFSSLGLQVHNFTRKTAKDTEDLLRRMRRGEPLPNVMETLASMLRPAILGPMVAGDLSAIEARGLPWLADDDDAEEVLDAWFETDLDPEKPDRYRQEAAGIFGGRAEDMTDDQRFIGKIAVLSLGFGGAKGAFSAMARNYGVAVSSTDAEAIVRAWRRANPWAERFWNALEKAAILAVRHPGEVFTAGLVSYLAVPMDDEDLWLYALLPSGRIQAYARARVEVVEDRWELSALKGNWRPKQGETDWPRVRLWRGLLAENADQGVCADLLRGALVRAEAAGYEPFLHTHDEMACANASVNELKALMETAPEWATGLPLRAEVKYLDRYAK